MGPLPPGEALPVKAEFKGQFTQSWDEQGQAWRGVRVNFPFQERANRHPGPGGLGGILRGFLYGNFVFVSTVSLFEGCIDSEMEIRGHFWHSVDNFGLSNNANDSSLKQ